MNNASGVHKQHVSDILVTCYNMNCITGCVCWVGALAATANQAFADYDALPVEDARHLKQQACGYTT
jgi:hypothetical protein